MTFCKTEVCELSDIRKDTWNRFLQTHKDQATVFHTQEWMLALQEAFGYEPKYLAAQTEDDSFLAAMPFMIDTRFKIKNYFSMPLDTYGGVIGDPITIPGLTTRAFTELPGIGMRYYVDYRRLDQKGDGFTKTIESTELLDLSQSLDIIWKKMDNRNRKHINAAQESGVMTRIAKTVEELHGVRDLLKPTPGIHGGVVPELIDAIFTHMLPAGYCVPYLTEVDGVPVVASLFFVYGNMAIYWAMSLHGAGRSSHAHYRLLWQVIHDFKVQNIKILNLGTTPETTNTVWPWKRSWGTQTQRYYIYRKVPLALRPILKIKEIING